MQVVALEFVSEDLRFQCCFFVRCYIRCLFGEVQSLIDATPVSLLDRAHCDQINGFHRAILHM